MQDQNLYKTWRGQVALVNIGHWRDLSVYMKFAAFQCISKICLSIWSAQCKAHHKRNLSFNWLGSHLGSWKGACIQHLLARANTPGRGWQRSWQVRGASIWSRLHLTQVKVLLRRTFERERQTTICRFSCGEGHTQEGLTASKVAWLAQNTLTSQSPKSTQHGLKVEIMKIHYLFIPLSDAKKKVNQKRSNILCIAGGS